MVVGFITTYAISHKYLFNTDVMSSNPTQMKQYYVIKFGSDLRQVGGFLRVFRLPPSIKLPATIYITEILLKLALNAITLTLFNVIIYSTIIATIYFKGQTQFIQQWKPSAIHIWSCMWIKINSPNANYKLHCCIVVFLHSQLLK